jgi:uncharacterized protein Yka (UPF0111/DUF47 family)
MGLKSDTQEFISMIGRIVEQFEEINSLSKRIPETELEQLDRRFAELMENLADANKQLCSSMERLEDLRSRYG